jgi:molybdopterin molybdotransferase
MRIGIRLRGSRTTRAGRSVPLAEALAKALDTAEPFEAIEVSLSEAVGLVLAEPAVADVDLPPFDRASASGFAVRSAEAVPGALLRVARPWGMDGHEVEPGEAARVESGEAMPVGADAVLGLDSLRPDPAGSDSPRVVEVLARVEAGRSVIRRGAKLAAGSVLAGTGTRLRPAMVPLLAAQGCVNPLCYRRVRTAIIAVGDHLVGPADAPVLHDERNASNLAVGTLLLGAEGMVHDLGAVAEPEFATALHRALNSHLILVLGRLGAEGRRALSRAGVEPTVNGVSLEPGGAELTHGVVRSASGQVAAHVVGLPLDPVAAVVAATLFVLPLLSRLQGGVEPSGHNLRVVWDAPLPLPPTEDQFRAVPARLQFGTDGRLLARPVASSDTVDLPDLARADGLALFPPGATDNVVAFAPFGGGTRAAGGPGS